MGERVAMTRTQALITELEPGCLAMCGVCAGRRGEVALGDVIIADRVWTYDTGKMKVEKTKSGRRVEKERGDMEMYRLAAPAGEEGGGRGGGAPRARGVGGGAGG